MSYRCEPCDRRFNKLKARIAHDDAMHRTAEDDGIHRFQIGRTYEKRSFADYDTIFRFKVVKRTAKTVTLEYCGRELSRKKVSVSTYNGEKTEVARALASVLIYANREEA